MTLVLLCPHPWIRDEERQFYVPVSQMESLKPNNVSKTEPNQTEQDWGTAVFHGFHFHYPTVV